MSELPDDATPNDGTVELTESQLSDVAGGLLLPAVQKVREAAARSSSGFTGGVRVATGDVNGDGAGD